MMKITKTRHAELVRQGIALETYEHQYDDGTGFTVNSSEMRARLLANPNLFPLTLIAHSDFFEAFLASRVFEEERVRTLTKEELEEPVTVMEIEHPNGEKFHLITDGAHRIIRRQREGLTTTLAWIIPQSAFKAPPTAAQGYYQVSDWGDEKIVNGKRVPI